MGQMGVNDEKKHVKLLRCKTLMMGQLGVNDGEKKHVGIVAM